MRREFETTSRWIPLEFQVDKEINIKIRLQDILAAYRDWILGQGYFTNVGLLDEIKGGVSFVHRLRNLGRFKSDP